MKHLKRSFNEFIPGALNGIAGTAVVVISLFVNARYDLPSYPMKLVGIAVVLIGIALALWGTIYLKSAILGEVQPRLPVLIKEGPYRFVRHPVYLDITIALFGTTVSVRNWLSLLILVLTFLPSIIFRARLEEKALDERFPVEWLSYVSKTDFLFPRLRRKSPIA